MCVLPKDQTNSCLCTPAPPQTHTHTHPTPCAVPGNGLDNSDTLAALSKAVASSVGKPEQVGAVMVVAVVMVVVVAVVQLHVLAC